MRIILLLLCSLLLSTISKTQDKVSIIDSDIELFWKAYDMIRASSDSTEQIRIINEEYIAKGSLGLKKIIEKRGYNDKSYVDAINNSPSFWESVRKNTLTSGTYAEEIRTNIMALNAIYPKMKAANIYFTVGAMMTGGSAHKGHVLIGSEIAMADSTAITNEIEPERLRENLDKYFHTNPIGDLVLLNVHEFVHTQQGRYGQDLLSMSIFEGAAEFISVLATKKPSATPAVAFGKANYDKVRDRFQKEMFSPHWNDWLYNDRENIFQVRDLGYYVGYEICEKYYKNAFDKKKAITNIIELDCSSKKQVREFVEESRYLSQAYSDLEKDYQTNRPSVVKLKEIKNGSNSIPSSVQTITILFSKQMNPRFRNFKLGALGQANLLPIESINWGPDEKSLILKVNLERNRQYQIIVDDEFRDQNGRNIEQYKIDFMTSKDI